MTVGLEDSNLCAALSAVGDLEELPVVGNNARGATASIVASPRRSCGHSSRFDRVQLRDRVTFPCSGGTSESTPEHLADALVVDQPDSIAVARSALRDGCAEEGLRLQLRSQDVPADQCPGGPTGRAVDRQGGRYVRRHEEACLPGARLQPRRGVHDHDDVGPTCDQGQRPCARRAHRHLPRRTWRSGLQIRSEPESHHGPEHLLLDSTQSHTGSIGRVYLQGGWDHARRSASARASRLHRPR